MVDSYNCARGLYLSLCFCAALVDFHDLLINFWLAYAKYLYCYKTRRKNCTKWNDSILAVIRLLWSTFFCINYLEGGGDPACLSKPNWLQ